MATSTSIARLAAPINSEKIGDFSAKDRISAAITPEIVIALCGPLGTPLHRVSEILKDLLGRTYDYKIVDEIRLSEFIKKHGTPADKKSIKDMIDAGNELRIGLTQAGFS